MQSFLRIRPPRNRSEPLHTRRHLGKTPIDVLLFLFIVSSLWIWIQSHLSAVLDDRQSTLPAIGLITDGKTEVSSLGKRLYPRLFAGLPTYTKSNESFLFWDEATPTFHKRVKMRMRMATQSLPTGSSPMEKTIFVMIPAYRDDLCPQTINEMYERAEHPERIFVGLCDQLVPTEDTPCFNGIEMKWRRFIRVVELDASRADGPITARFVTWKLWDGERYTLSIDAHMHFIAKWDTISIGMIDQLPPRSLVSHYPVSTESEIGSNNGQIPWICSVEFDNPQNQLPVQTCGVCMPENISPGNKTCPSPFLGAGFYFGTSGFILDVPPDRRLPFVFHGEEILLAARLWTHGYTVYAPLTNPVSHVYGNRKHNVFSEGENGDRNKGYDRLKYFLQMTDKRPPDEYELDLLGMGEKRTLESWFEFSGLDLKKGVQEKRCHSRFNYMTNSWEPASIETD